jgi:hypothetical protein
MINSRETREMSTYIWARRDPGDVDFITDIILAPQATYRLWGLMCHHVGWYSGSHGNSPATIVVGYTSSYNDGQIVTPHDGEILTAADIESMFSGLQEVHLPVMRRLSTR